MESLATGWPNLVQFSGNVQHHYESTSVANYETCTAATVHRKDSMLFLKHFFARMLENGMNKLKVIKLKS